MNVALQLTHDRSSASVASRLARPRGRSRRLEHPCSAPIAPLRDGRERQASALSSRLARWPAGQSAPRLDAPAARRTAQGCGGCRDQGRVLPSLGSSSPSGAQLLAARVVARPVLLCASSACMELRGLAQTALSCPRGTPRDFCGPCYALPRYFADSPRTCLQLSQTFSK